MEAKSKSLRHTSAPPDVGEAATASKGKIPSTARLRSQIVAETKHIERDCRVASTSHFAAATFWTTLYYLLGIPATIVAGVAGLTALADHTLVAATLAIVATALTATTTFLNAGEKAHAHGRKRFQYEELKNDVRVFREVTMKLIDDDDDLHRELMQLCKLRNRLNRDSPQVRQRAVARVARELEREDARARQRGRQPERSAAIRWLARRFGPSEPSSA